VSTVKKMSTEKSENLPESSCPQKAAEAVFVPTSSSHDFTHKVQGKKCMDFFNNLNFFSNYYAFISGYDWNQGLDYGKLMESYLSVGFQATTVLSPPSGQILATTLTLFLFSLVCKQ